MIFASWSSVLLDTFPRKGVSCRRILEYALLGLAPEFVDQVEGRL